MWIALAQYLSKSDRPLLSPPFQRAQLLSFVLLNVIRPPSIPLSNTRTLGDVAPGGRATPDNGTSPGVQLQHLHNNRRPRIEGKDGYYGTNECNSAQNLTESLYMA